MRIVFSWLCLSLVFLVAAAGVCIGLQELIPAPPAPEIRQRLDEVVSHRGNLDMVFIGSSRVFHQFDPAQFDRELGARGISFQSYNMGFDGLRPPESLYVTRALLALRPQVKWVFFELWDSFPNADFTDQRVARVVAWHDFRHTRMALRHLASRGLPWRENAAETFKHATLFIKRLTSIGHGADLVSARLRPPRKRLPHYTPLLTSRGFVPIERSLFSALDSVAGFEASVQALKTQRKESLLCPALRDGLRELIAEVRAAGATPVFVVTPTIVNGEGISALEAQGLSAPLISFADLNRFPELYETSVHSNGYHLNARGAAIMTSLLVEAFTRLLDRHAPAGAMRVETVQ